MLLIVIILFSPSRKQNQLHGSIPSSFLSSVSWIRFMTARLNIYSYFYTNTILLLCRLSNRATRRTEIFGLARKRFKLKQNFICRKVHCYWQNHLSLIIKYGCYGPLQWRNGILFCYCRSVCVSVGRSVGHMVFAQ